ncbi:MAG: pectinesterase family protein [Myxococcota bacterium]|nr:pectinesterase family protein [Myxococcota bacterium]
MRIRHLSSWFVLSFCVIEGSVVACGGGGGSSNGGSGSNAGSGSGASTGTSGAMSDADGSSASAGSSNPGGDAAMSPADASGGGSGAAASSGGATSGAAEASTGSSGAIVGNDAAPPPDDGGLAGAAPLTGLLGTPSRPQLSAAQAAEFTIANYLAQTGTLGALTADHWNPTAGLDATTFAATYKVAKTGATYATVQAAVDAAVAAGGSKRVYIQIAPGTYDEQVCILASAPPITLYSTNADATQTVIQHADFQSGLSTLGINPCMGDTNQQAATLDAFNDGFQAKNLTIQNTATNAQLAAVQATLDAGAKVNSQAVALATKGDQVILDNVRILSHQDTLFVDGPAATVRRVYAKNSYVAGDVDFIFGAASAVFDHCVIEFVSDRTTKGQPLAPDTENRNAYGFLVINSAFTADANTAAGAVSLGRAWDHSCGDANKDTSFYVTSCVASGMYPNGQAVVMNSTIDAKYSRTAPWQPAATTGRGYSSTSWACVGGTCPANRLYEYNNTGAGSM